jgi:DNA polymerase-1
MAFRAPLIADGPNAVMRVAGAILGKRLDEPTGAEIDRAVATTLDRLERAREAAGAERVIVAFDAPTSWRKTKYAPYKASRSPERTAAWQTRLRRAIGDRFACYRAADHEADDVIATLVARAAAHGHRVAVLSSDSDLLALAGAASVYQYGAKGEPAFTQRTAEWVCAKYGIADISLLAHYKALVGEQGEGVPGIAGIGPVKARKLLHEHGDLERLIFRVLVPEADARLMLDLVTLRADAPVEEWPLRDSLA